MMTGRDERGAAGDTGLGESALVADQKSFSSHVVEASKLVQLMQAAAFENKDNVVFQPHFPYVFLPPDSDALRLWSMIILLLVVIQSFTIPLEVSFLYPPNKSISRGSPCQPENGFPLPPSLPPPSSGAGML